MELWSTYDNQSMRVCPEASAGGAEPYFLPKVYHAGGFIGISAETVNNWCRNGNTVTNLGIGNLTWVPKRQKTLGADKSADVGTHRVILPNI